AFAIFLALGLSREFSFGRLVRIFAFGFMYAPSDRYVASENSHSFVVFPKCVTADLQGARNRIDDAYHTLDRVLADANGNTARRGGCLEAFVIHLCGPERTG